MDGQSGRMRRIHSPYSRRSARRRDESNQGADNSDAGDPEEKLVLLLKEVLVEHSRQRLRATHMTLRRYGTVENRITQKDLQQAFQENQIKLSSRLLQMLTDMYQDHVGVDYERLYKCLLIAHLKTGRDSVKARLLRNDLSAKQEMTKDQRDEDFLCRLEDQLIKERTFFDIDVIRKDFQSKDTHRSGKISKEAVLMVCDMRTPLYGALLKNLMKRCDEDKNEMISWPEFLNFLEKSQQRAWKRDPELAQLPEKAKMAAFSIASNPIEELSSGAKSRVVSRLLKKASIQREKSNLSTLSREKSAIAADGSTPVPKSDAKPEVQTAANTSTQPKTVPANQKKDIDLGTNEKTAENDNKNIGGKKEGNTNTAPPVIEVEKPSDDVTLTPEKHKSAGETPAPEHAKQTIPNKNPASKPVPLESEPEIPNEPDIDDTNTNSVTLEVHGRKVKVIRPENYKDTSLPIDPPQERLQLDWVYGYRGNDCRSNIHVLGNGEILYFISNIAILYNRDTHAQRHFREHTSDIKCMAVHSNGNTVASGQFTSRRDAKCQAHIRVWRADTLNTTHILGMGHFQKAVMCLAFQKDSDFLAAVDNSTEKKLSVWNTADGSHMGDSVLQVEVICDVGFNPTHRDVVVTIGKEHLAWWKMYPETRQIHTHAKPEYDSYLRAKFVICLTHTEKGDLITGDSNGTIYVWGDGSNRITNFVKHGHDGPVFTVLFHRHHLMSGGRDGMIFCWQWTKNMDNSGKIEVSKSEGGVRMLQPHKDTLLVGTTMNSILSVLIPQKGSPLEGATLEMLPLTQGHFDELRGLATMSESFIGADFLTAGVDGIICKFNTGTHLPVWKIVMKGAPFLCADCSQGGQLICLGTHDGHLVILHLDAEDLSVTEVLNKKISKERLDTIKFSPDCKRLAVGGHDKAVYVFSLEEKEEGEKVWEMIGKCKGHRAPVTAVDWSKIKVKDTHLLRSSSAVPEEFFWNPATCVREEARNAVTLPWVSHTCTLDHTLTGVWSSKQGRESHINSVDVNPAKTVVAMGDNSGCLSLFRYPCPKDGVFSHTYKCHLNVQTVRFSSGGSHILSVGGRDSCVMQWKVV